MVGEDVSVEDVLRWQLFVKLSSSRDLGRLEDHEY